MPTYLENLTARRDAVACKLAAIMADSPASLGGVATNSGEGDNPDHDGHVDRLYRELEKLDGLIAKAENKAAAAGGNVGFFDSTSQLP